MVSNCLFEAIKAKLKNPKNVKIFYWTPSMNEGRWHFLWEDLTQKVVTHYNVKSSDEKVKLFFDGKYKTMPSYIHEGWCIDRLTYSPKKLIKFAKKFNFRSVTIPGVLDYCHYGLGNDFVYTGEFPQEDDYFYLKKVLRRNVQIKVALYNSELKRAEFKILTFEEMQTLKESIFSWKYITPYDSEFIHVKSAFRVMNGNEVL